MTDKYADLFVRALVEGEDEICLSMLVGRQLDFNSVVCCRYLKSPDLPVLFAALVCGREKVALALMKLGASIDDQHVNYDLAHTPAGYAIWRKHVDMLSMCHRLGARMDSVCLTKTGQLFSALEYSIKTHSPTVMCFLLDEVYTARPVDLSQEALLLLIVAPARGIFFIGEGSEMPGAQVIIEMLKAIQSRGFDFKRLQKENIVIHAGEDFDETKSNSVLFLADVLLASAQKLGSPQVMRFLTKHLGVVSSSTQLEIVDSIHKKASATENPYGLRASGMGMTNFKCASPSCDTIGTTYRCSGCHISRYCSSECQLADWKTGGHKKVCRDLRKDDSDVAAAGSSRQSAK